MYQPLGMVMLENRLPTIAEAYRIIAICNGMNAFGVIVWDIDHPDPASSKYKGSPDRVQQFNPGAASLAAHFFARFRQAGLRVGVCLRPSILQGNPPVHKHVGYDPYTILAGKAISANELYGCDLFYIDSPARWHEQSPGVYRDEPLNADVYSRLVAKLPGCLFIPEGVTHADWWQPNVLPYGETDLGFYGSSRGPSVINPTDGSVDEGKLVTAVKAGNILLFRAWFNDARNDVIKSVYTQVNTPEPPPMPTPITITDSVGHFVSDGTKVIDLANSGRKLSVDALPVEYYPDGIKFPAGSGMRYGRDMVGGEFGLSPLTIYAVGKRPSIAGGHYFGRYESTRTPFVVCRDGNKLLLKYWDNVSVGNRALTLPTAMTSATDIACVAMRVNSTTVELTYTKQGGVTEKVSGPCPPWLLRDIALYFGGRSKGTLNHGDKLSAFGTCREWLDDSKLLALANGEQPTFILSDPGPCPITPLVDKGIIGDTDITQTRGIYFTDYVEADDGLFAVWSTNHDTGPGGIYACRVNNVGDPLTHGTLIIPGTFSGYRQFETPKVVRLDNGKLRLYGHGQRTQYLRNFGPDQGQQESCAWESNGSILSTWTFKGVTHPIQAGAYGKFYTHRGYSEVLKPFTLGSFQDKWYSAGNAGLVAWSESEDGLSFLLPSDGSHDLDPYTKLPPSMSRADSKATWWRNPISHNGKLYGIMRCQTTDSNMKATDAVAIAEWDWNTKQPTGKAWHLLSGTGGYPSANDLQGLGNIHDVTMKRVDNTLHIFVSHGFYPGANDANGVHIPGSGGKEILNYYTAELV